MILWTEDDRDAIKKALMGLVSGSRLVRTTHSSEAGQRAYEYGQADIPQLKQLLAEITASLDAPRTVAVRTGKCL